MSSATARKTAKSARGDRRLQIAECALSVLAREGARGLTHRAVDESARLPIGSTSYYFRTRDALIAAAAARLCELDERDVVEASRSGGVPFLLERWTSPSHRHRLIARFELFLDATRNPKTRKLIRGQRRGFIRAAQRAFESSGAIDAALRGEVLVATIDGLLLAHLFDRRRSFDEVRRIVSRDLVQPRTTVSPWRQAAGLGRAPARAHSAEARAQARKTAKNSEKTRRKRL